MTTWTCHRLRPELVDFAEGRLGDPRRALVERHLASCAECVAAIIELREVPGALRRLASADPPEQFWTRQRTAILAAIGEARPAATPRHTGRARSSTWKVSLALAASVAALVVGTRWSAGPVASAPVAASRPTAASASVSVASIAPPTETTTTASAWQQNAIAADNVLYVEDTSLLSLAERLDDDSAEGSADSLI